MIEFRQLILAGDVGSDVLAVKNTLRRLGIKGSGALNMSEHAGPAFVTALKVAQRRFEVEIDGKYGKNTHAVIAPQFDTTDEALYGKAETRKHEAPPAPAGEAAGAANQLLQLQAQGKFHCDNPADLADINASAAGQAVHGPRGLVHVDERVFQVLIHLIGLGHTIGTFAICSDHHDDGPNGHAGGKAVDISSIDAQSVGAGSSRALVIAINQALHNAGPLKPRQLISGGCGNVRDSAISALSIPGADSFYGADCMHDHCNHIHVGY
jgi:peptidoglycan hydrolase-like protein with peptidoglycan-binding domain